jgi:hypothetical protein
MFLRDGLMILHRYTTLEQLPDDTGKIFFFFDYVENEFDELLHSLKPRRPDIFYIQRDTCISLGRELPVFYIYNFSNWSKKNE